MGQERIWEHFQNEGAESFRGAEPRLRFLVRSGKRWLGTPPRRALNIGIGDGALERMGRAEGWAMASLDPGERSVAHLKAEGVDARVGYIEALPFESGEFDLVFCSEVLEHLESAALERGLREIGRCLRGGGLLVGSVPFREDLGSSAVVCPDCGCLFHRWGHHQSFDHARLRRELGGAGFQVLRQGHRSFLQFRGLPLSRRLALMVHWGLGMAGVAIASPTLYFVARKP